jgi:hypothetical protein
MAMAHRPINLEHVAVAVRWLRRCNPDSRTVPSSDLQRIIGRASNQFISNGAVIVAAVACGLEVRPGIGINRPSAAIFVTRKRVGL